MDKQSEQQAKAVIYELQIESSLLQIVIAHLTARIANEAADPSSWLRDFADDIHASIDRVAPPKEMQALSMVEVLRGRLDKLIYGVQTRLRGSAD